MTHYVWNLPSVETTERIHSENTHSWVNENGEQVIRPKISLFCSHIEQTPIFDGYGHWVDEFIKLNDERLALICKNVQKATEAGDDKAKRQFKAMLPAITPMSTLLGRQRQLANAVCNGIVMIDIDHVADPAAAWRQMHQRALDEHCELPLLVHVTPSGHGLRMMFRASGAGFDEDIRRLNDDYHFDQYGDLDTACRDRTRMSYLVSSDHILSGSFSCLSEPVSLSVVRKLNQPQSVPQRVKKLVAKLTSQSGDCDSVTARDTENLPAQGAYADYEVGGRKVADVVKAYIVYKYGEQGPRVGERHTAYGHIAMTFAAMCDANPQILVDVIPQLDPDMTREQAYNFCLHYCEGNYQTQYSKEARDFLKIYDAEQAEADDDAVAVQQVVERPKEIAPIIDQLIPLYQEEFGDPIVFIATTLLGWRCMNYYAWDRTDPNAPKMIRPLFMSVLVGPPNSGKSFKERLMKLLFPELSKWDNLYWARVELYKAECEGKSPSKKPRKPKAFKLTVPESISYAALFSCLEAADGHGTLLNSSEASDLQIMLSDALISSLLRKNFDGETVQKMVATEGAEGRAKLAMCVAVSSQLQILQDFCKNRADFENGIATRFLIALLDTRKRGLLGIKELSDEDRAVIEQTMERINRDTFQTFPTCEPSDILKCKSGAEADKLGWKPVFNPMVEVNIDFIYPTLNEWYERMMEEAKVAETDILYAFAPRVKVRATRFALLLTILHNQDHAKEEVIKEAVKWWLDADLRNIMAVWGEKYAALSATIELPDASRPFVTSVYEYVPNEFTMQDVDTLQKKYGQKTEARKVISKWKAGGLCEKTGKNRWRKVLPSAQNVTEMSISE